MLTTFQFNPAPGTPAEVVTAFQDAADLWSAELIDPNVIVSIDIDFQPLAPGVLGGAASTSQQQNYANVRQALVDDVTSVDDTDAIANLPAAPALDLYINLTADNPNGAGSDVPYVDNNGGANNTTLNVNTAVAKALGFNTGGVVDGDITFSDQFEYDFDPTDGIVPTAFDFVGLALHEIGHVLGFVSGVDDLNISNINGPENADAIVEVTPLDLFRYSDDSLAQGATVIDFTADTREKFFTVDGGVNRLGTFSTGQNFGDGNQAGHWEELTPSIGLMGPAAGAGELTPIFELDLRAFDAIGWDRVGGTTGTPTVPPLMTTIHVSGTVFHDGNDNGVIDPTEMGIPGHTVFHDANGDGFFGFGEQAAITNDAGAWHMVLDLGPPPAFGPRPNVELRLAMPPGTVSTTGDPNESVAILSAEPLTNHLGVDFGLLENIDYGDAPQDLIAPITHSFPTVGADAASHGIVANFHLGATVDGEPVGLPGIAATGDDLSGGDDEDGILFPAVEILPGADYTVTVTGSSAAFVGYFQMWVDFNLDGDWDDAGEQVLTDVRLAAGSNSLTFPVPAAATPGITYARGRLGFSSGLGPDGHDLGGEVEDYQIVVGPGGPGPLVLTSSGDFGSVDFLEVTEQVSTSTLFEMSAAHSGLFTVEATPVSPTSDLQLHIYDPHGTLLASSSSAGTDQRLDVNVEVGDGLLLVFSGDPDFVDLRLTNLVANGESLYVFGTDSNDNFRLSVAEGNEVNINGVKYDFSTQNVSAVTFYSGNGLDTVNAGSGWIAQDDQSILLHELEVYSQGNTTLRISKDMPSTNLQLLGDFGVDGVVDATDLDLLFDGIRAGSQLSIFDVNHDDNVNRHDADFLVEDVLHTAYGDADLDHDVDIADFNRLVVHFDPLATNRNWSQGDYDGDGDVDITDFQKIVKNFDPIQPAANAQGFIHVQHARMESAAHSEDVSSTLVPVSLSRTLRGDVLSTDPFVALVAKAAANRPTSFGAVPQEPSVAAEPLQEPRVSIDVGLLHVFDDELQRLTSSDAMTSMQSDDADHTETLKARLTDDISS